MIDPSFTYRRDSIEYFLQRSAPYATVPCPGAGRGSDLLPARNWNPGARRLVLEGFPPNVERLAELGVEARQHDPERDHFPYTDESLDTPARDPLETPFHVGAE